MSIAVGDGPLHLWMACVDVKILMLLFIFDDGIIYPIIFLECRNSCKSWNINTEWLFD
jgi:hypothetical protein